MTHHITDEQIFEAAEEHSNSSAGPVGETSDFWVFEREELLVFVHHVLALAEPAPHGAIDLLSEFSEAMSDSGDWPDTYDERTRLKSLVDRVRFYLEPAEQWATVPKGGEEWSTVPKGYTAPAPAVPSIDYMALIDAALVRHKYAQGTRACVAFKHGAEWFREQALTAAPTPPAQPKCLTCNGHGLIGGHMQDGSGYAEGCPDCNPEPAVPSLQPACRYISDVLSGDASPGEKHIARTIMHLLPLEQAMQAQPAVPEDVARNAERYRWLRDMASQDWLHRNHNYQNLRGAAFDAAIDAARKAEKGGAVKPETYKQAEGSKNCMQCAAAYMLGIPLSDVPDFEKAGSEAWEAFYAFFADRGFSAEMFPPTVEIDGDYLASGQTKRGTGSI